MENQLIKITSEDFSSIPDGVYDAIWEGFRINFCLCGSLFVNFDIELGMKGTKEFQLHIINGCAYKNKE